jgi:hypothetical protein
MAKKAKPWLVGIPYIQNCFLYYLHGTVPTTCYANLDHPGGVATPIKRWHQHAAKIRNHEISTGQALQYLSKSFSTG